MTLSLLLRTAALLGVLQIVLVCFARLLRRRLRLEAIAVGLLLPWLVLAPWFFGSKLLAPTEALAGMVPGTAALTELNAHAREQNDAMFQFIPWELEVRHAFAQHRLPFWSDLLDGGSSPWANPQAGALSPIAMLTRAAPIQYFFLIALALKILTAFEGAWLLARAAGARRLGAMVAGVSFALGGGVMAWALFPHSTAAAWVPWLVAATILLIRRPAPRTIVATSLLAAAVLLSGQVEVAVAGAGLALLAGLWFRRRRIGAVKQLLPACLAALIGFGLAAPQLVPFLELLPRSQRAHERWSESAPGQAIDLHSPKTWFSSNRGRLLLTPLNPDAHGVPFQEPFRGPVAWTEAETLYAGLVALLGVAAALLWRRRRAAPFLLAAGALIALASSFIPMEKLLSLVPPLRLPEYVRFLPAATLALAVAGGLGIDALSRGRLRTRALLLVLGVLALSLTTEFRGPIALLWLLIALAVAAPTASPRLGSALLALALLLDLVPWARTLLPSGSVDYFYPTTPQMERIQGEVQRGGPWRAVGQDYLAYPSILPVYGLAEVRAHNPLVPIDYLETLRAGFGFAPSTRQYISPFRHLEHPFLSFLNARVVASNRYEPPVAGMTRSDLGGPHEVVMYVNEAALPRWFLPTGADVVGRDGIGSWIEKLADPRRVALFADEVASWRAREGPFDRDAVRMRAARPGRIDLEVGGEGERLLATSVPGWGWQARGGSGDLRTLTVNGAFLGVVVPAGVIQISLRYLPPGWWLGAAFFLAALGSLVAAARVWRPAR